MNDEERRRMLVNAAVAVVVVLLVGFGVWVTDRLARQAKLEDCLMAHRRNCRGFEITDPGRADPVRP